MPKASRSQPGFSLIELLVTFAIIAIVTGLVLMGVSRMRESAKVSQTRAILAGLNGIATEYEVMTTKPLSHHSDLTMRWDQQHPRNAPGHEGTTGDLNPTINNTSERAKVYMERFVAAVWQMPTLQGRFASLGDSAFVDEDGNGFMEVRDAWGNPIAYINGVTANRSVGSNPPDEFAPAYDGPFFASAGPDGRWGQAKTRSDFPSQAAYDSYQESDAYAHSRDNLYSFDIDRGRSQRDR